MHSKNAQSASWRTMLKAQGKRSGFTLVELLLTMGIIAVLSGVTIYLGIGNYSKRGRDGRRKADLESIRSALELYRNDNGSYLPGNLSTMPSSYLATVPADPKSGQVYVYAPACVGGVCPTYNLCAALETGTGSVAGCVACNGAGATCNYLTQNP